MVGVLRLFSQLIGRIRMLSTTASGQHTGFSAVCIIALSPAGVPELVGEGRPVWWAVPGWGMSLVLLRYLCRGSTKRRMDLVWMRE